MSYSVSVFPVEARLREQQYTGEDFFADEANLPPFTPAQLQQLRQELLSADFALVGHAGSEARYEHAYWQAEALLTTTGLYMSAPYEPGGAFEISLMASEMTDTGELAKYDEQAGGWEDA